MNLHLYTIAPEYIRALSRYDRNIQINHGTHGRPYVGIILDIHGVRYFAPLGHPKEKYKRMKNTIDFMKIANGKFGAINFNNMIPVPDGIEKKIDFRLTPDLSDNEKSYRLIQQSEYLWINQHDTAILARAEKLHYLYCENSLSESVANRCCNFPLLEKVCMEYRFPLNELADLPNDFELNKIYLLVRTAGGQLFHHNANETWELSEAGYEDALDIGLRLHRDFILLGAYDDFHFLFMQRDLFQAASPLTYEEAEGISINLDKEVIEDCLNLKINVRQNQYLMGL